MMVEAKIEIIDNQIFNFYEYIIYKWKKIPWYSSKSTGWYLVSANRIGKQWTCPEIYHGKITLKDYFLRDIRNMLNEEYNFIEIHNITIHDNKTNI